MPASLYADKVMVDTPIPTVPLAMVPVRAFRATVDPEQATLGLADAMICGGVESITVTAAVVVQTASEPVTL